MRYKKRNSLFLILIGCVFAFGIVVFLKTENNVSELENRSLSVFRHFTISDFIEREFQDSFEAAISDQFLGSEQIKYFYNQIISGLPTFGIENLVCSGRYLKLESEDERVRGTFDCKDYIVYLPDELTEEKRRILESNVRKYNKMNGLIDVFYYFVDDASSFDFKNGNRVFDYYAYLSSALKSEQGLKRLEYDNFDGYMRYFYKTDHHWNKDGSYQGYQDIIGMLGFGGVIEPKGVVTNHENFFGSNARMTGNFNHLEEFEFYKFDIPKHDTLINGEPGKYGHYEDYEKHNYDYDKAAGYYAYVYGDDYGEVIFDFCNPKNENLLIISNSYSNAVNELIAQYYNKTFVVDLRHYQEQMGREFIFSQYIKENRIDKVLMIISPSFVWSNNPNRGLDL